MKQTPRTRKLGENVKEVIATILQDEIADPRLELVTVTGVDVSGDLMLANVFVTAHGGPERYEEVLEGLDSASGRIRAILGRRIKARFTPELRFFIDESVDAGMRMSEALRDVPPTLEQTRHAEDTGADDTGDADVAGPTGEPRGRDSAAKEGA